MTANPIARVRGAVDHFTPHHLPTWDRPPSGDTGNPVLSLRGAAVRVGGRTLWSGVDLTVGAGEFTAVLGPNGVGKSTLIKVLLGVLPSVAGEIRVLGERPGQGGPRRQRPVRG